MREQGVKGQYCSTRKFLYCAVYKKTSFVFFSLMCHMWFIYASPVFFNRKTIKIKKKCIELRGLSHFRFLCPPPVINEKYCLRWLISISLSLPTRISRPQSPKQVTRVSARNLILLYTASLKDVGDHTSPNLPVLITVTNNTLPSPFSLLLPSKLVR